MAATVKVTDLSENAAEKDLWEFFAFSGDIKSVELKPAPETSSQVAYITFLEEKALDTALLLTGAVIVDKPVHVEPAMGYTPPENVVNSSSTAPASAAKPTVAGAARTAQSTMTDLLAKGYILGKDAMAKAKDYDEKHALSKTASQQYATLSEKAVNLSEKASATAVELDRKIGLSSKINAGAAVVDEQVKGVDEKYQVSEKTRSAFTLAEEKLNEAGAAILRNKYVASGLQYVQGAFGKALKVADDVGQETAEKIHAKEAQKTAGPQSPHTDDLQSPAVPAPSPVDVLDTKPEEKEPAKPEEKGVQTASLLDQDPVAPKSDETVIQSQSQPDAKTSESLEVPSSEDSPAVLQASSEPSKENAPLPLL
eukprot:jgi/Mesen1/1070/ME000123S00241